MAPSTYGSGLTRTADSRQIGGLITCCSLCVPALPPSPSTHLLWQFSPSQTPSSSYHILTKHQPMYASLQHALPSLVPRGLLSAFSFHIHSYLVLENTQCEPEFSASFGERKSVKKVASIETRQNRALHRHDQTSAALFSKKSPICLLSEWSWALELSSQLFGWWIWVPSHTVKKKKKD